MDEYTKDWAREGYLPNVARYLQSQEEGRAAYRAEKARTKMIEEDSKVATPSLSDLLEGVLNGRQEDVKAIAEGLSPGARDLLERAGLGDIARKSDEESRAAQAALAVDDLGGIAPRVPAGLAAFMLGSDQPAPTPEQVEDAERRRAVRESLARRTLDALEPPRSIPDNSLHGKLERRLREMNRRQEAERRAAHEGRVDPARPNQG